MKFYCKQLPLGEWLSIPYDWKVRRLYEYFIVILKEDAQPCESLTELCQELSKHIAEEPANFWLIYYYTLDNICILAAEENYFSELDHEVIEI